MHYFVLDENRIFLLCDKVSVVPQYIANVLGYNTDLILPVVSPFDLK